MATSRRRATTFDLTKAEFLRPQTRLDANNWLDKASFGPATAITNIAASTKTSIVAKSGSVDDATKLMSGAYTYASWCDEQQADNTMPTLQPTARDVDSTPFGDITSGNPITSYTNWFTTLAVYGSAKLRLKMTFALSQIFVLRQIGASSEANQSIQDYVQLLYNATLSNNTSSYRKLCKDVFYNVQMGQWLTYLNNAKENVAAGSRPDQNMAREFPQLFGHGVYHLNMDGTLILDSNGQPIPTYFPSDLFKMSEFVTGLGQAVNPNLYVAEMSPNTAHEIREKTLYAYLNGSPVTFPAQLNTATLEVRSDSKGYLVSSVTNANTFVVTLPSPAQYSLTNQVFTYALNNGSFNVKEVGTVSMTAGQTTATITKTAHGRVVNDLIYNKSPVEESLDAYIDHVFNHPSCPPFIAKSLIKFFVTSNPTPQYVKRVAEVFVNNGNGVRGDLAKVVKAILCDREAIIPFGKNPNNHGRQITILERTLRLANALRSDIVHVRTATNEPAPKFLDEPVVFAEPDTADDYKRVGFTFFNGMMQFMVPPSVFNFYRPGYVPPASTIGNLGLTGPELQILNQEAQTVWVNMVVAATDYKQIVVSQFGNDPYGRLANTFEGLLDLRGNEGLTDGSYIELNPHPDGFVVTSKPTTTSLAVTGIINLAANNTRTSFIAKLRNRRTNAVITVGFMQISAGGGTKNLTLDSINSGDVTNTNVGDRLDFAKIANLGHSGFPTCALLTGGGEVVDAKYQPHIPLYHKAALALPDTAGNPTQGQIDSAIAYIESIFMPRPISTELKAIMSSAATQPVTLPTKLYNSDDAATNNHYLNLIYGYNQIRIRRMIAMLLVSPEYAVQY